MAASPVTGERPTGFRRSSSQFASLPHRTLSFHEKVGLAKDDAAADVLYAHPSVRIYSFQPPTDALKSLDKTKKTLPDADYPIDAIEVLPWRARTETLAARGKLIIEKVQGSVHFLKAGELIHTIMKNSQCWCVDGESKFVMRIGRLRYQRIEMPTAEPEDKQKVEEFKEVIGKILKFEKTPCPFIRAFHVDLPEDAITPRRRGTWKRKESLTLEDESRPVRKAKPARTMSMRGMPPSSFPSRSLTQLDMERPRTASTPTSGGRFSFPDVRTESPIHYTSGEDNTDSDHQDSESDRPDTGHSSEVDESDRELSSVPFIKSPLHNVENLSHVPDQSVTIFAQPHAQDEIGSTVEQDAIASASIMLGEPESAKSGTSDLVSTTLAEDTQESEQPSAGSASDDVVSSPPKEFEQDDTLASAKDDLQGSPLFRALIAEVHRDSLPAVHALPPLEASSDPPRDNIVNFVIPDTAVDKVESIQVETHSVRATSAQSEKSGNDDPVPILEPEATPSSDDISKARTNDDAESVASFDSFRTVPSDEDERSVTHEVSLGARPFQHRRELSEMTVTAASVHDMETVSPMQVDGTTEPIQQEEQTNERDEEESWPEMHTPGAFTEDSEIRQRLRHRRSLSPLPPASILQTSNSIEQHSPIPAVLLQKAATLAVVKPLEVFVFVVQVLARIAGGATMNDLVSGDLFRRPGVRRTASGTFDQAVRGRSMNRDSDEEDDYGLPVHGRRKSFIKQDKPGVVSNQEIDDAASFASID